MALFPFGNQNRRSGKVVPIPRFFSALNVGTLLFGLILVYILITLIFYLTQEHVTGYEVVRGTISGNYRYRAIALKDEEIETANESGNITYYAREGAKANVGMMVCAVGGIGAAQAGDTSVVTDLSDEDMKDAKDEMSIFAINFDRNVFSDVYDFKSDMQGVILQATIDENAGDYVSGSYEAPLPGFVVYSTDGLEGLTADKLSEDKFDQSSYTRNNLRLRSTVSAGDPVYKLVTNDTWSVCFPVNDRLKTDLEGITKISIRFLKDNISFSAPLELVRGLDGTYGKITLKSSLVRYVTENENTQSEVFLIRETFAKDGSSSTSNVTATVYSRNREKGYYLINPGLFNVGDYVVMPGTSRKYQISDDVFETIQGVYNINKGYTIFREVNIIDENEEFCIVDPSNVYGLSAHDRIVLDASQVDSDEIIT